MRRRFLIAIACACLVLLAATRGANAQASASPTPDAAGAKLVEASKAAILSAGLSAPYFEKHFRLLKVFNLQGDRRVVWQYTVGEYAATLNDAVGFYTDERGRRVDTHSIRNLLPTAHEIERTITRARAERIMRACIGAYKGGGVVYAAQGSPPHGALVFTASAATPRASPGRGRRESRERREREEGARKAARKTVGGKSPRTDEIENEDEEGGPPVSLGMVDLETGRCTKGLGIAGHP